MDELYERVLVKPLAWISETVFLRGGDRAVLDGSLHGLASAAQRAAAMLSRAQSGSLQLYVLLVMIGVAGALLWGWHHG